MRLLKVALVLALLGLLSAAISVPATDPAAGQSSGLTPRLLFDTPVLQFDFPALHVGVAEYDEGPTGATVFSFPKRAVAAVDVRGGAPGTINTDILRLGYQRPFVNAIAFAGGSSYGLAVAAGVADEIKTKMPNADQGRRIPVVAGAIIFDLGSRRFSTVTPDYELGRSAVRSARPGWFPLGARGAGRFAMQGGWSDDWQYSGQGAAYREAGPTKVVVFTVVNAFGSVVDRQGQILRCRDLSASGCGTITDRLSARLQSLTSSAPDSADRGGPSANTTITLVVTNQKLQPWALQRLAVQVHTSMARAIQPFSTGSDGDTLYAVTTGEVDNPKLSSINLGLLASEVAWDAVLASVPPLPSGSPSAPFALPDNDLDLYVGAYEFDQGIRALVHRNASMLKMEIGKHQSLYLPAGKPVELIPVSPDEFALRTTRADRVRFERSSKTITGLTINPGPWSIPAKRVP